MRKIIYFSLTVWSPTTADVTVSGGIYLIVFIHLMKHASEPFISSQRMFLKPTSINYLPGVFCLTSLLLSSTPQHTGSMRTHRSSSAWQKDTLISQLLDRRSINLFFFLFFFRHSTDCCTCYSEIVHYMLCLYSSKYAEYRLDWGQFSGQSCGLLGIV